MKIVTLLLYSVTFNFISYETFASPNSDNEIPKYVYKATPTPPSQIFKMGFKRFFGTSTDLSEYMYSVYQNLFAGIIESEDVLSQLSNPSAFIRTSSVWQNTMDNALSNNEPFLNSYNPTSHRAHEVYNEIYVYQIVPQPNFISVTQTYERILDAAYRNELGVSNHINITHGGDLEIDEENINLENLEYLRPYYTRRREYAALYNIHHDSIVSARRFRYSNETGNYEFIETIQNPHYNPEIEPAIHENNYLLGSVPNYRNIHGFNSHYLCNTRRQNSSHMYKKRSTDPQKIDCDLTTSNETIPNSLELETPKFMFDKKGMQIEVNTNSSKTYCLSPYDEYLYIDYCEKPYSKNKWLFTEFGQLISEINDGKNNQYYCLSFPENEENPYLKMEICDLRNPRQKWYFKETEESFSKLMSSYQGNEVRVYKNYGFLSKENSEDYGTIKVLNHNKIKENVSKPLYQFNIEIYAISNIDNTELFIYPLNNGYNYLSPEVYLNGYKNYYNMHNHSFFSNYGIADGSQVCYISKQIKIGSSFSEWVENDYCSNQDKMPNAFQWFFKEINSESNLGKSYNIIDIGKNKLRTSKKFLSKSYKALYTANLYWYDDSDNILETFYLPSEVQNLFNLDDPNKSLGSQFQINIALKPEKNEFK
jgi:hypothetical protein